MEIAKTAKIGQNVLIRPGTVIEDNVVIGDNCVIDYGAILRENVTLGPDSFVGAGCILGEYLADYYTDYVNKYHPLSIGPGALLRSGTILYGDTRIGEGFSTGHRVTIREQTVIGDHVSIGTLSDLQGFCQVGDWVHMHSNVHIGQKSSIGNYCWIYPYVVLTNDPTPPSETLNGVTVEDFAVVCTGSVVLPGLVIGRDALVGAGCVVTKDVPAEAVMVGNPGKVRGSVRDVKDPATGQSVYPWRYTFRRGTPWQDSDYETWARTVQAAIENDR